MGMVFRKCWRCGNTRECFPYSQECVACYQKGKHIERRIKRAAADPAEGSESSPGC